MSVRPMTAILHLVRWFDDDNPANHNLDHIAYSLLVEYHRNHCRIVSQQAGNTDPTSTLLRLSSGSGKSRPLPNTPPTTWPTRETGSPAAPPPLLSGNLEIQLSDDIRSISVSIPDSQGRLVQHSPIAQHIRGNQITWTLAPCSATNPQPPPLHSNTGAAPLQNVALSNSDFISLYKSNTANSKRVKGLPYTRNETALQPVHGYNPLLSDPDHWTDEHPLAGLPLQIQSLPPDYRPPPSAAERARSFNCRNPKIRHNTVIEAVEIFPASPSKPLRYG